MKKNSKFLKGMLITLSPFAFTQPVSSQVQAPTLKINGYTSIVAAIANQQRTENGIGGSDPFITVGASDLYFTVLGRSASGFEYKWRLNFDVTPGTSPNVKRNYGEFNHTFGTIQFGNLNGPEDSMPESAMNIIGGAYGINGTLPSVYNNSAGVISGVNFIGESSRATKIVFYSPEVSGFQLGVAYTPNTTHMGKEERSNAILGGAPGNGNSKHIYYDKNNNPFGTRNIVMGLTYKGISDKWSCAFSVVGMTERSHLAFKGSQQQFPVNNANSYQLSAAVGYDKVRIAAGWIDNKKSRMPKDKINTVIGKDNKSGINLEDTYQGNAGNAWNLGASYTLGAYQFATGYFRTDRKTDYNNKAHSDIVTATADFTPLQGLKFFSEVDIVKTRTNEKAKKIQQSFMDVDGKGLKAIGNNSATVFMLGSKISF